METVRAMALSGSLNCSIPSRTSCCSVVSPRPSSSSCVQRSIAPASFFCGSRKLHRASYAERSAARRGGIGSNAVVVVAQAQSEDAESLGPVGVGAIGGGLVAVPVVAWSLYSLKTTGCGLPPGPGGAIGALEGVSYLVIVGVIGWSIYTKVKTGAGLPAGPFGLLGAVEGLSYLAFLAILVVFGLQALDYGFIPGPLPGEQCFG